uniref:Uncharacterized protein n=1 Tax=Anguilla anguilla TaxID=7936 RepID=A0A0E9X4M4_ANGAN
MPSIHAHTHTYTIHAHTYAHERAHIHTQKFHPTSVCISLVSGGVRRGVGEILPPRSHRQEQSEPAKVLLKIKAYLQHAAKCITTLQIHTV